jgi:hypothetical protein
MLADQTILKTMANSQLKRVTTCNSGAMFKPSLTNSMGTTTINTLKDSRQIMVTMAASGRATTITSITTMSTRVPTTVRLSKTINRMIMVIGEKIRTMVEGMVGINMTLDRAKVISQRQTTTEVIHIRQTTNLTLVAPHRNLKIR